MTTALELLRHGEITVQGRLVEASNATLFCSIEHEGVVERCVYKPVAGERPLWDFPDGSLAGREVASYALSVAGGFDVVPPTVLRDGPFGEGMCQLWVDTDEATALVDVLAPHAVPDGWRHVLDALGAVGEPVVLAHADDPRLRRMAVLDVVLNNADRKGGHVLAVAGGHRYGVDHGVCFHVDPKLRTVLWGWATLPLREDEQAALSRFAEELAAPGGELRSALDRRLTPGEVRALRERCEELLAANRMPLPSGEWPAIPWPAF